MHRYRLSVTALCLISMAVLTTACSGRIAGNQAVECSEGLKIAYVELEEAEVNGFGGTVAWSKAAGLLTAASVQKEFEKYPNCVDKVRRARLYIREAQR
ncbi:MAG TPA: hypothetical protein VGA00_14750 [Acidiferrobacterales bacterium]